MQCYIDDLVVEEGDLARYFEMKAGAKITWGDPECEHTMSWNFKRQKAFDDRHQQKAEYHLVLANPDRQRVLGGKAPEGISVIGFPFTNTITEIAASRPNFISTISELLGKEAKNAMLAMLAGPNNLHYAFNRNDIYLAFWDFNGVYNWLDAGVPCILHDILEQADYVSRGSLSYEPKDISEKLRHRLLAINGISAVETCKGMLFLRSTFGMLTQFPTAIGSVQFREFARAVLADKVSDINDLQDWIDLRP